MTLRVGENGFIFDDTVTPPRMVGYKQADGTEHFFDMRTAQPASYIPSGVYTPTLADGVNIAASTIRECHYYRVGDVVHVAGQILIDPTLGAGTSTEFTLTLPIASNLANSWELAGTITKLSGEGGVVIGDATNNKAQFYVYPVAVTNGAYSFTFAYRVLS